jgi:replication-associated recombination protein RarA
MIRYQHTEEMPRQSGRAAIAARCAQPAMKQWGYSVGYEHAHKFEDAITGMPCLPASLDGKRYYHPTDRGMEKRIGERLEEVRKAREAAHGQGRE